MNKNKKQTTPTTSSTSSTSTDKNNREKSNQELLEKNNLDKDREIEDHEQKKLHLNQGIDKSYTLVKNTLGQLEKINDVDQYWVNLKENQITFITYQPTDNKHSSQSEEALLFINTDVAKLLKFKYHIFWCHVLFNQSLHELVDSFLRFYQRPYQPQISILGEFSNSTNNITSPSNTTNAESSKDYNASKNALFKRMFFIIVRMSLMQEKSGRNLSKEYFANAIYDKQLFTIPKIFDICVLFAPHSKNTVVQLVQSLFDVQPKYHKDLLDNVNLIIKAFKDLNNALIQSNKLDFIKLEDSSRYLMDIAYNVDVFLRVFPQGTHGFYDPIMNNGAIENGSSNSDSSFLFWLVYYYEAMIPIFTSELPRNNSKDTNAKLYQSLKQHLLSVLHSIIKHHYLMKLEHIKHSLSNPCLKCKSACSIQELTEQFMAFLGSISSFNSIYTKYNNNQSRQFNDYFAKTTFSSILYDYQQTYGLADVLLSLKDLNPTADDVTISFFMKLIGKDYKFTPSSSSSTKPVTTTTTTTTNTSSSSTQKPALLNIPVIMNTQKISAIKELFGDYGDFFIHSCLKYYNDEVEQVINALCDISSLPPHLASMDKSLNTDPKSTPTQDLNSQFKKLTIESPTPQQQSKSSSSLSTSSSRINNAIADKVKSFITNYEQIYDDEYDDSLDAFIGVSTQDGESLNNNDDDIKEDDEEDYKPSPNNSNSRNQQKSSKPTTTTTTSSSLKPKEQKHYFKREDQKPQQPQQPQQDKKDQKDQKPTKEKQQHEQKPKPKQNEPKQQQQNEPKQQQQQQQQDKKEQKPQKEKQNADHKPKQQPAKRPSESSKPKSTPPPQESNPPPVRNNNPSFDEFEPLFVGVKSETTKNFTGKKTSGKK